MEAPNLVSSGIIDAAPYICWERASNGDNIWHAYARTNGNMDDVASLCISPSISGITGKAKRAILNDPDSNNVSAIYTAFLMIDKYAKSYPLSSAYEKIPMIAWVRAMAYKNNNYCNQIASDIDQQNKKNGKKLKYNLSEINQILNCRNYKISH